MIFILSINRRKISNLDFRKKNIYKWIGHVLSAHINYTTLKHIYNSQNNSANQSSYNFRLINSMLYLLIRVASVEFPHKR